MKSNINRSYKAKKNTTNTTNFQDMSRKINGYLKEDSLNLNFAGYTKTVSRYFKMHEHDLDELYRLMIECNLWSNYISEVENLIQYKSLEAKIETDRLCAFVQKKAFDYQLEQDVKMNKLKTRDFEIFHKQLISQRKFFEKAYWHCYKLYGNAVNTLIYKAN